MIRKISLTTAIFILLAVYACKKNDNAVIANRAVVVAYLIPGKAVQVKIYQQKAFDDTATYGELVSGLNAQLSDGQTSQSLQETATGTYTYADTSYLQTGKTYTLNFSYNGEDVSATTTIPAKPVNYTATVTDVVMPALEYGLPGGGTDSVAISFRWDNPDSVYHVLVFKNDLSSPFRTNSSRGNAPVNFTINAKQTTGYDINYRSFNYTGVYRAILFHINKEYADVLSTNANTSSQQLSNPPGNITNGYGIFTAMQADTIVLQVRNP